MPKGSLLKYLKTTKTKYKGSLIQEDLFVMELKKKLPWVWKGLGEVSLQGNELLHCNWNIFKSTYNETAESILGFRKIKKNTPWKKEETWPKIEQSNVGKKDLEEPIILEPDSILHEAKEGNYKKVKEVKQSPQQNKIKESGQQKMLAKKWKMPVFYDFTKALCNSQQKNLDVVKDKGGNLMTTERGVLERWKEHFQGVLNRPEPEMNVF